MFSLHQIATILELPPLGADLPIKSISTDSRTLEKGDLFIALIGENHDGHEYLSEARTHGAIAALVMREVSEGINLQVPDTLQALGQIAAAWRQQLKIPLIAVAGSNGKTTVKEMIASILRSAALHQSWASPGNFNNAIGLPLSLLGISTEHHYAVVELGMNHQGEMNQLSAIARPTIALVNNAQREHHEFMHSVTAVAEENGCVYRYLPQGGWAIINADDSFADYWRQQIPKGVQIIDFGMEKAKDVQGQWRAQEWGGELRIQFRDTLCEIHLQVPGKHNGQNASAAVAAALATGISWDHIKKGLESFTAYQGRLQKKHSAEGAVIIDDTYNANPDSMRAAIEVLCTMSGTKIMLMGAMGEVGDLREAFHQEVGAYAKQQGIDQLWVLGDAAQAAVAGFGHRARFFTDTKALLLALPELNHPQTTILIKGSRSTRMEQFVSALLNISQQKGGTVCS